MDMLLVLILWIAPPTIIFCAIMAIRETRINRRPKVPTAFIASMMDVNGPDRKWGGVK